MDLEAEAMDSRGGHGFGRQATDWKSEAEKCPPSKRRSEYHLHAVELDLLSPGQWAFSSLGFPIRGSCLTTLPYNFAIGFCHVLALLAEKPNYDRSRKHL